MKTNRRSFVAALAAIIATPWLFAQSISDFFRTAERPVRGKAPARVVFQTDSLGSGWDVATATDHLNPSYVDVCASETGLTTVNLGNAGRRILGQPTGAPLPLTDGSVTAAVDSYFDPTLSINLLVIAVATNDIGDLDRGDSFRTASVYPATPTAAQITARIVTVVSALRDWINERRAIGWTVVYVLPAHSNYGSDHYLEFNNVVQADPTTVDYFAPLYYHPVMSDSNNANTRYFQSDETHYNLLGQTLAAQCIAPIISAAVNRAARPNWATFRSIPPHGAISSTDSSWLNARAGASLTINRDVGAARAEISGNYFTRQVFVDFDTSAIPDTASITQAMLAGVGIGTPFTADDPSFRFRSFDFGPELDETDFVPGAKLTSTGPVLADHRLSAGWSPTGFSPIGVPTAALMSAINSTGRTKMVGYLSLQESATPPSGQNSCHLILGALPTRTTMKLFVIYQHETAEAQATPSAKRPIWIPS